jgi:hypothetical protein
MHYVYIIRDVKKRRNVIDTAKSLRAAEKKWIPPVEEEDEDDEESAAGKAGKKAQKPTRFLVYYECLKTPAEAAKRKAFLLSEEGAKEANRWLLRLNRTTAVD